MGKYEERADALFHNGFSCAQSVFCAFCPENGLTVDQARHVSAMFGGGVSRTRQLCGAVNGMLMAAGVFLAEGTAQSRPGDYAIGRRLMDEFKAQHGSCICRELLGLPADAPVGGSPDPRTPEFYQKRPCPELVRSAAAILEAELEKSE